MLHHRWQFVLLKLDAQFSGGISSKYWTFVSVHERFTFSHMQFDGLDLKSPISHLWTWFHAPYKWQHMLDYLISINWRFDQMKNLYTGNVKSKHPKRNQPQKKFITVRQIHINRKNFDKLCLLIWHRSERKQVDVVYLLRVLCSIQFGVVVDI